MRALVTVCFCVSLAVMDSGVGRSAWAQQATSSGSVGAGALDGQGVASVDLGLDVTGEHYALGLGGRVRWLLSDEFRGADWDQRSEWANVVRYLTYRRDHGSAEVSLAVGQLGGVSLGHGALLHRYHAGLNIDHRHLGVDVDVDIDIDLPNVGGGRVGVEAAIDDLIAPRIVGIRSEYRTSGVTKALSAGLSVAADLQAPDRQDQAGEMIVVERAIPMFAAHGRAQVSTQNRRLEGAVYLDAVAISTMAVGLHVGLSSDMVIGEDSALAVRAELRLGSDHYIPGWIGPLYEINRWMQSTNADLSSDLPVHSQLDIAQRGSVGGMGGLVEARLDMPELGEFTLSYARRAGLPDQLLAHISVPYFRDVQGAVWTAAELGAGAQAWILATEIRARINRRLFASVELSRLYVDSDSDDPSNAPLKPIWGAMATFGVTLPL